MIPLTLGAGAGLAAFGIPLGLAIIGGVMLGYLIYDPAQLTAVPTTIFDSINQTTLVAVPLFIIAGALVAESGLIEPLVALVARLLRWLRGGLALTGIATGLFFAGATGSTAGESATIARALDGPLTARGYDRGYTGAVVAAAASLGILFPPSITLIIFGSIVQYPIDQLWLAGIVPGLIAAALLGIVAVVLGRKQEHRPEKGDGFVARVAGTASTESLPRLLLRTAPAVFMPILVIGGVYSGILTVSETAAILVAYVAIYGLLARNVPNRKVATSFVQGCEMAGMIFLVITAAHVLTSFFVRTGVATDFVTAVAGLGLSKYIILILVNALLLVLGTIMDGLSALIIATPILYPLLTSLGLSPVHIAVMLTVNIEIGVVHPPVGMNLVAVSGVTGVSIGNMALRILPFIAVLLLILVLVTYGPFIGAGWLN